MVKNSERTFKKYRLHSNKKIENILLYVFIFLCIYIGRDTLPTTTIVGYLYSQSLLFICFICLVGIFIYSNKEQVKVIICEDIRIKLLLLVCIFIILSMLINFNITLRYFSILFCISIAFFINFIIDYKKFLIIFTHILVFLCIYSLISIYIFRPLFIQVFSIFPTFHNSSHYEFINMIFAFPMNDASYLRNFGIFREPGVFQFFITMSLVSKLFILKKDKYTYLYFIIFSITMFSTFSTAGIIQLFLIYIVAFILYRKEILNTKKKRYIFLSILICSLFVFFIALSINNDFYWTVYSMISKLRDIPSLNEARSLSIVENLKLFINHPMIGNAMNDVLVVVEHNTSSTLILAAVFGVIILMLHIYSWLNIVFTDKFYNHYTPTVVISLLIILFIVFMSFNSQNLITNNSFYIIPISIALDTIDRQKLFMKKWRKNNESTLDM